MTRSLPNRASQRGVALLLVLWACTLLAILLGGYGALARTEGLQARYQFAQTQAHYTAEAGLMRAIYSLQDPQLRQRWISDGRAYTFRYNGAAVVIHAVDEGGKVDLNTATPEVLRNLFHAVGLPPAEAELLAMHVVEWRNPLRMTGEGDAQRAAYAAAGLHYGPRNGPFVSMGELQLVLGMTPALYRRIEPVLTIWSGNTSPNPNTSSMLALQTIPGMTPQQLQEILAARQQNANDPSMALNNGTTHSIQSEATLADGTRAVLRATVRMQAGLVGIQPYAVLRWREGEQE
ncbi:MAG: type II secretion system protein GspK [Rhodanobacter sp.]